ncbi:unnamed protein product, partial [Heterotrigona itama]
TQLALARKKFLSFEIQGEDQSFQTYMCRIEGVEFTTKTFFSPPCTTPSTNESSAKLYRTEVDGESEFQASVEYRRASFNELTLRRVTFAPERSRFHA